MTVQQAFLLRSLDQLERVAAELDRYREVTAAELDADLSLRWTVERGLLAGVGLALQTADHILANHFQRTPDTYEGLLRDLHTVGVIGDDVSRQLKGAGGFRNVLVHEYVNVDLREVVRFAAAAPSTLRAFARDVLQWMEDQTGLG